MVRISNARLTLEGGRIDRSVLKAYGETLVGGASGVNTGTAYTLDITTGNAFHLILTGNCTFTFSNPVATGNACTITILLKQDAIGARTVTWPASVRWVAGVAPTITSQKNRYDILTFTTYNAGTLWFGFVGSQNFQNTITTWVWGNNQRGQLAQNDVVARSSPTQIGALTNWKSIAVGGTAAATNGHVAAVKIDGTLWTWGHNGNGPIGDNTGVAKSSPVQVGNLATWVQVGAGDAHVRAIDTSGKLWSWGYNAKGQVGDITVVSKSSPVQVGTLTTWASVAVGGTAVSGAIKTDGTLWMWGDNTNGAVGDNTNVLRSSPVGVGTLTTWSSLALSVNSTGAAAAIKTDGTLWMWGVNSAGQLAQNDTTARSSPVQVGTLTTWSSVSVGNDHILALKTDGSLWGWGGGGNGRLGSNDTTSRSSPIQITSEVGWTNISAGMAFSVGIKTSGSLWSWGKGVTYGLPGQNDIVDRSSPTQVGSLKNWTPPISAGSYHAAIQRFT